MAVHPLAGKPAPAELLIDVARLERAYHERKPDLADPTQRVSFGTIRLSCVFSTQARNAAAVP